MPYSEKLSDDERRARQRENARRYRERHPERVKEAERKYRESHPGEAARKSKEWREANPEKMHEARKRWVENNREQHRATRNAWQAKNRETIAVRRNARYAERAPELRAKLRTQRTERKQHLVDMLGGVCVDCRQVPHLAAFEFDHVGAKTSAISSLLSAGGKKWEKALEEIAHCELVCANCHRVRTATRTGKV